MKLAMPQMRKRVAQTVLTAMAAVELQSHCAGRQIEIVVRDEHFLGLDLPVAQRRGDRDATLVHIRGRLEQIQRLAVQIDFCRFAVQLRLHPETRALTLSQGVNKPEPGVVPGSDMFGAGIAEADDKAQSCLAR